MTLINNDYMTCIGYVDCEHYFEAEMVVIKLDRFAIVLKSCPRAIQ